MRRNDRKSQQQSATAPRRETTPPAGEPATPFPASGTFQRPTHPDQVPPVPHHHHEPRVELLHERGRPRQVRRDVPVREARGLVDRHGLRGTGGGRGAGLRVRVLRIVEVPPAGRVAPASARAGAARRRMRRTRVAAPRRCAPGTPAPAASPAARIVRGRPPHGSLRHRGSNSTGAPRSCLVLSWRRRARAGRTWRRRRRKRCARRSRRVLRGHFGGGGAGGANLRSRSSFSVKEASCTARTAKDQRRGKAGPRPRGEERQPAAHAADTSLASNGRMDEASQSAARVGIWRARLTVSPERKQLANERQ
jgi:hypothetical protein